MNHGGSLKKTALAVTAIFLWIVDSGCGGSRGGGTGSSTSSSSSSSASVTSSSDLSSTMSTAASSSVVTVQYTGPKTLYGYQLQLTATDGLVLEKDSVCKFMQTGGFGVVNEGTKTLGAVSYNGFSGPVDLFNCTFSVAATVGRTVTASDYSISGVEVVDGNGNEQAIVTGDYKITVK